MRAFVFRTLNDLFVRTACSSGGPLQSAAEQHRPCPPQSSIKDLTLPFASQGYRSRIGDKWRTLAPLSQ